MSRSASSTPTGSCAANILPATNSCRRWRSVFGSATWCWAGTRTISSTTTLSFTGWHTAYPDALGARAARDLPRRSPSRRTPPLFLSEFAGARRVALSARRSAARARSGRGAMGYAVNAAVEFEFFLFDETPHSVRDKGYRRPPRPSRRDLSAIPCCELVHAEFYHELLDLCHAMDMELEGLHTETGPGRARSRDQGTDDALLAGRQERRCSRR